MTETEVKHYYFVSIEASVSGFGVSYCGEKEKRFIYETDVPITNNEELGRLGQYIHEKYDSETSWPQYPPSGIRRGNIISQVRHKLVSLSFLHSIDKPVLA